MAIGGVTMPARTDFLPLTGGTVDGPMTITGHLLAQGNITGNASSADYATYAEGAGKWGGLELQLANNERDTWIPVLADNKMDYITKDQMFAQFMLRAHPVGSIYQSTDPTNPSQLFGGTWENIKDRFLLAAGDTYWAGSTGGEATHTLTVQEMPSHYHDMGHIYRYDNTSTSSQSQMTNTGDVYTTYTQQWTSEVGGNQPHNNMPPYLSVYTWRRTA